MPVFPPPVVTRRARRRAPVLAALVALLGVVLVLAASPVGALGVGIDAARQATPAGSPAAADDPCSTAFGTPAAHDHGTGEAAAPTSATGDPPPFDLVFIDAMVAHHEGAITMAEVALVPGRAAHPEVADLAASVIASQGAEVTQLLGWRDAWYSGAPPTPAPLTQALMDEATALTGGMADAGMGGGMAMAASDDVQVLCQVVASGETPFDLAFIDRMVPHHQTAIGMAEIAVDRVEHAELLPLALTIVTAQTAELAEMAAWRDAWFGVSATPVGG